jgi:hypothetical protein
MPCGHPRLELEQCVLQAVKKEHEMQKEQNLLEHGFSFLAGTCLILLLALSPVATQAQSAQDPQQEGVEQGNYNIKQSVEFGYRFSDVTGNQQTYQSFVNLKDGARLLDFSTEMRSLNHHGTLFDRLYFSNFGYGGDPQNVSRLRISKNRWYEFDGMFRKDQYFWDYSLLANPLNPTVPAFANAPANFTPIIFDSPHLFSTRRKLQDYSLLLFPDAKIRLRLGYDRNTSNGPGWSTIHQGTEQLLMQEYSTTMNTYRVGVDFRLLPRTNISYDQLWNYYKGDTGSTDQNQLFSIANGAPVDIGVSLNAGANQPCANTFLATGFVNPTCSAYFDYLRHARTRTNAPTEQLSLQSNYFPKLDFSAKASYTSGSAIVGNWLENWDGRESRTAVRNQTATGSAGGERVAATFDFGATWRITQNFHFIDSFHYGNFHNPVEFDSSTCLFFSPSLLTQANVFSPAAAVPCAPPSDGVAGTPAHSTSSGADYSLAISSRFLKQDEKMNLSQLEYQFSPRLGVRGGFRYRHRSINDKDFESLFQIYFPNNANRGNCAIVSGVLTEGCTPNGDGSFTFITPTPIELDTGETLIDEYSGLFGVWAKPLPGWRISFDTELMSADNTFTRISPRQSQEYRIRSTYRPAQWMNLSGSITIWEARNNVPEINNLQHNRFYGFSAGFQPKDWMNFELGYDYNDVFSQILICYTATTAPPGLDKCPGSTLVQQLSTYTNNSHFGYFDVSATASKRLTARVGGNFTGTSGSVLIISPNAPTGPLDSVYYQPFAGLDYRFAKSWTGKAYWGFHNYHEDQDNVAQDIFAPRNFHANTVTLSLRYSF